MAIPIVVLSVDAQQEFTDWIETYCHQRQINRDSLEARLLKLAIKIAWDIKPYKNILRYPEVVFVLAVMATLQLLKWPAGTNEEWIVNLMVSRCYQRTREQFYSDIRAFRYLMYVPDLKIAIEEVATRPAGDKR